MFNNLGEVKKYLIEYHSFNKDYDLLSYDYDEISDKRSSFLRFEYSSNDNKNVFCRVIIKKSYQILYTRLMKINKILNR